MLFTYPRILTCESFSCDITWKTNFPDFLAPDGLTAAFVMLAIFANASLSLPRNDPLL